MSTSQAHARPVGLQLKCRAAAGVPRPGGLRCCLTQGRSADAPCACAPPDCSSITRQHLADYIATNYTAPRMVISAAGAVDHDALVKVGWGSGGGLLAGSLRGPRWCARHRAGGGWFRRLDARLEAGLGLQAGKWMSPALATASFGVESAG